MLAVLARNPGMYNLLTRTDDDKDVGEVRVNNSAHFGKRIRDLALPEEVLILALHRNGEYLIPTGDTYLEPGDKLSLLGQISCLERATQYFR
jgi:cell volume regulation protein A